MLSPRQPDGDPAKVAAGDYGPVPLMMTRLLRLGQTGALDGLLLERLGVQDSVTVVPSRRPRRRALLA